MNNSLTIRETRKADRPAVLAVIEEAFGQPDEARLVKNMWNEDEIALDLVAEENGAIIGHCAFSVVSADPPLEGVALGLAPLSVSPARQRSGIGAALVETGLDICKTRGASLMTVLGEPEYYSRFGFKPASSQNMSWAGMDAADAFQIIDWASVGKTPRRIHYHQLFSSL